jgi:methionine biosynthesis protein MetW
MTGQPHYHVEKKHYGIKQLLFFLHDTLTKKNLDFYGIFDSYEEYWSSGTISVDMNRAKLIEDWFEFGSEVLDVGTGDGQVCEYLMKRRGLKVAGLDISEVASEKARQRGIGVEIRDINNGLGLKTIELYDYVLLSEVIEHTQYPNLILIDAIRHSKKGVVVTIPNSAYLKWRIQLLRGYFPRQSFTHLHYWSIKDFELFCKALRIHILDFRAVVEPGMVLPKHLMRFNNLLAYQQAWLLAPASKDQDYGRV